MHTRLRSSRTLSTALLSSLLAGVFTLVAMPRAQAQSRVNDHDMRVLMQNLHDDAKSFRPEFDHSIQKSTIRKTSQAKDSRDQAKVFARQTGHLLDRFKKDRNGQAEFNGVMTTAEQLNTTIHSVRLDRKTMDRWHKIRAELRRIADAYGVPFEMGNGGMGAMNEGNSASCVQTAGEAGSKRLVNECLQVSPATHPPCNAANSCEMIESEIRRGCSMVGENAPGFCAHYR